jgi:pilin isopeptide linkage protein
MSDITPAKAQVQMTKTIHSNSGNIKGGEFTFHMYSNGQLVGTTTNDAAGNIIFPPVTITSVGEMDYQVIEVPDYPPKPGWIYDTHQCTAHISTSYDAATNSLVSKVTYSPAVLPNFVNTYYLPEAPVTIQNKVITHGKNANAGQFKFDIVDADGNVIGQASNDADGNIVFPEMNLTGGEYDYKIIAPSDGNGWTFDKKEIPVHVSVAVSGAVATPTVTYPADPNFNATYKPNPANTGNLGAPHSAKVVSGGTLNAGQFTFGLYNESGELVSTATNGADGVVFFPPMSFDKTGVFDYTIKEISPSGGGWTSDTRSFIYRATVTDNGSGQLSIADTYPLGSPRFMNLYRAAPAVTTAAQTPKAVKIVTGGTLSDGQFNFGVYDEQGNLLENAVNDAAGNVTFAPLSFSRAGVYNYTVRESTPDGAGYTTDKTSYPYKITVTDDGNGHLVAVTDPENPNFSFNNTYTTAGSESILAYKTLKGLLDGQTPPEFSFTLKDKAGNIVKTAVNKDGTIDFGPHTFTEQGDYEYTVNEVTPLPAGWSSDKTSYRVIVHMEDDGAGNLIASVTYPDSGSAPNFVNTYASRPANVGNVITNNPSKQNPTKTTIGNTKPVQDSYFVFYLYDDKGNLAAIGFSDPNGKIRFPIFFSSKLGTSNYTMKEINIDDRGWTTDRSEFPVEVTVTDNGQGLRFAEVSYPGGTPNFTNTYKAADAEADIDAKVIGHGNFVSDGQFEFDVVDSNGNIVGKAKNDAAGNIVFPELTLPDGEYDYKILAPADGGGWRFDVTSLPVHVHVYDNGNGTSTADVTYPAGNVFNPSYPPAPANAGTAITNNPSGEIPSKSSAGFPVSPDQFMFGIYDSENTLVAVGFNGADGNIRFPNFLINTPGDFEYTMKEITVDGNGWITDKHSFPVKISVTDPGTGSLSAAVSYPSGTPRFINNYIVPAGISVYPAAHKTVEGAKLAAGGFSFGLFDESGEQVSTAVNDENGDIVFPALPVSEPGVYRYKIRELAVSGGGWEIDSTIHSVTVTVTENGEYQLSADITYDGADTRPEFINTYHKTPDEPCCCCDCCGECCCENSCDCCIEHNLTGNY